MRPTGIVVTAALFAACAGRVGVGEADRDRDAALLAQFEERVERYMELREAAAAGLTPLESTVDPARIKAHQEALAARIRAARPSARHGDLFPPEVREHFRGLLAPELKGADRRDIRARLRDDAPAPGAVPLEVNAVYPSGTPFPTMPAALLLALPTLPRGLEYRVIGGDLVLLDQPANLIVDYIRNAIPPRATAAPA